MTNFPITDEYVEAHEAALTKERRAYKKTLSLKNAKLFTECEKLSLKLRKLNVPFTFFFNVDHVENPEDYYTFCNYTTDKFESPSSQEYQDNVWDNITKLFPIALCFFAKIYRTKIIAYSLAAKETIFDTHTDIANDSIDLTFNNPQENENGGEEE